MPIFAKQKQIFLRVILFALFCGGIALFSTSGLAQWATQSAYPQKSTDDSSTSSNGTAQPSAEAPTQLPSPAPTASHAADDAATAAAAKAAPTHMLQAPSSATASSQQSTPEQAKTSKHHHGHMAKAAPAAPAAPQPAWVASRDAAVREARNGNNDAAAASLGQLHRQHPDDVGTTRDYLTVLSWEGGHDDEAVHLYEGLHNADQPDYVLLAVGHAYRGIQKPDEAHLIYERGLSRNPANESMAAGLIYSLSDAGYAETAMKTADTNIQQYGYRSEVLIAAGDAADQYGQNDKALRYYEAVYNAAPQNREAIRGIIRSKDRAGDAAGALKIADAHPGVFPANEYRHVQADVVADLIRKGQDEDDYKTTDHALQMDSDLISQWSKDPDAKADVVRVRLDRIIALRNRNRMQEVVTEYNQLQQQGVTIPPYVLSSVGDAYLYLHEPEKARDLYLEVLKTDPKNFDVRRQLFYAYCESDEYRKAFQVIDDLEHDRPYWANLQGEPDPALVKKREDIAWLAAGSGRQFAGMNRASENWVMPYVQSHPGAAQSHEALGNLYLNRGQPRQALTEYQAAVAANGGKYTSAEVGEAGALMQQHRFKEAEQVTNNLAQRAPDNLGVQRAERDQQVYNMSEVRISAGYSFRPMTSGTSVNGGEAFGIDAMYYTPPIGYNWRAFIGEYYAHQDEPNHEGPIGFSRSTVGAEYRNGPWTVEGGPTYNRYNGTERIGGAGDASYVFNDQWTVAGGAELFSRDTPLRALNAGTTSNEFAAHAVWRQDDTRELRFGGAVQPFSDGNTRTGLNASYAQNVVAAPDYLMDGLIDLGESQNTKDENRPYYNPGRDFIALLGPRFKQTLYQRYYTVWTHSLRLEPGVYWQEHYGMDAAFRARYEHRLQLDNVFDMGAGINFSRQAYDGVPENDVSLTLDLTGRF